MQIKADNVLQEITKESILEALVQDEMQHPLLASSPMEIPSLFLVDSEDLGHLGELFSMTLAQQHMGT